MCECVLYIVVNGLDVYMYVYVCMCTNICTVVNVIFALNKCTIFWTYKEL